VCAPADPPEAQVSAGAKLATAATNGNPCAIAGANA